MGNLWTFDSRFLRVSCDSSSRVHDFAQREEVDERFARVSELFNVVDRIPLVQERSEIAVDAAQCCGTSTRAVNGQVRQCNSMCLLRCSCEHAEMRRYVVVRQQRTIVIRSRSTHGRSQRGGYRKIFFHKKMHITNLRPFFVKRP